MKVGIIGPGKFATEWLAPALAKVPDTLLWSVFCRNAVQGATFTAQHQARSPTPVYTDLDQFLDDPALEAVIVASPDHLHAVHTIAAARAGKHVFVEKPMATTARDAAEMVETCRAHNVTLAIGHQLRWHKAHLKVKKYITTGQFGMVRHLRIRLSRGAETLYESWRTNAVFGGWLILSVYGTHALDLATWWLEPVCGPIVDIGATIAKQYQRDETAAVSLRFANGTIAEILISLTLKQRRSIEIEFERKTIYLANTAGPGRGREEGLPYYRELNDFVSAIREKRSPATTGPEGLRNIALLEKISNHAR